MEEAAGARYGKNCHAIPGTPAIVTYADDFVALCHSREQAETVRGKLSTWLKPRGLSFNQDKTRIVRIDDGFDFLSFNIRRYYTASGTKVLIKPSKGALSKIRRRLRQELRDLRGAATEAVIRQLNPIIRGQLPPHRRIHPSLRGPGPLPVAAPLHLGPPPAPQQGPEMGHHPLLRHLQQGQDRHLGLRRPPKRRLPLQVRLDKNRPARRGHRQGIPR